MLVDGETLEEESVESCVLQGSVLGGIFFGVFIEDFDEFNLALLNKFADDTKMARIVENKREPRELQADINKLADWAAKWKMAFYVSKCKVMHVGRRNIRYEYEMCGTKLAAVDEEKDLGVWIHSSMKPTTQCERAAKSANMALGMIMRAFHY